jgi:CRISPR-associated protein, MJ1666 family
MQTKKIIYQIGRLDNNIITDYKFQIDEKTYESKLSSFALKKHFDESGDPSKVILIYPYSILLSERRPEFNNKLDEFFDKLKAKDAEEINQYLKNPYAYLEYHPHSKEANDFIVIHSIGEYMGIKFSTSLGDVVLRILIDMMQRYLEEPFEEMYLDISSGLNVYASAMIEAGRVFLTLISLQKMSLQKPYLKVYISFSEPIIPANTTKTYEIYKDFQLDVKAFFQFPENPNKDNIEKLNLQTYKSVFSAFVDSIFKDLLTEENSELKDKTNEIVYKAYLFYSALKNNTPLALYHLFSDKNFRYDEEEIDDITKELIRLLKDKFNSNFRNSPELDLNDFKKIFIMLSLAKGMIRVLKDRLKNITQKDEISVSLKDLEDTFTGENSLYKPFGLDTNIDYLKNELKKENIEKEVRKSKNNGYKWVNHKWEKLYDLVEHNNQHGNNKNRSNKGEFDERNFKAHCGFENNITQVAIINVALINNKNKIKYNTIVRYSPDGFEKVVKTLLKS